MAGQDHAQRIGRARRQILQRFAVREAHQPWRCEPGREQHAVLRFGLRKSLELPGSVIDVVEVFANFCRDAGRACNGCAGGDAAVHRTGINVARPPARRDALRKSVGLGHAARSELQRLAAAKALRLDAFDMTMPGEEDLGHVHIPRTRRRRSVPWRGAGCNGVALMSAYDGSASEASRSDSGDHYGADDDRKDKVCDPASPAIEDEARWIAWAVEDVHLIAHGVF